MHSKALTDTADKGRFGHASKDGGAEEKLSGYRWVILAISVLSQMGATVAGQGIPTLGYFLQREWLLTRAEVGMFVSAIYISSMLTTGVSGLAADLASERLPLLIGQVVAGGLVASMGFTSSFQMALLVLVPVGLFSGMVNPSISKGLLLWFPTRLQGFAMGVKFTGVPLGGAIAAAVLPSLAIAFSWRVAVVALGLGIIASGIASFLLYKEPPKRQRRPSRSPRSTMRSALGMLLTRDMVLLAVAQTPLCAIQFATTTYLLLYLNEQLGIPVLTAALVLSLVQLGGVTGRILWGVASDRTFGGDRYTMLLALVLVEVTLLLALAAWPATAPFGLIVALAAALGLVAFGWQGVYMAQVGASADPSLMGTVYGFIFTAGHFGIVAGPPIFGFVVDHTGSYRVAWLVMAGFAALTVMLVLMLRKGGPGRRPIPITVRPPA